MKEYLEYYTLASFDDKSYKFSMMPCKEYNDISLEIDNRLGKEYYDNSVYIYGEEFYDVIKTWIIEKEVKDGESFTTILKDIPLEDFNVILQLLERSLELGWYKLEK